MNSSNTEVRIFINAFPIGKYFSLLTHICNHIPMHRRFIFSSSLQIRLSDRHMDSTSNFFIKKNISGGLRYIIVCPDSCLTKSAGSGQFKYFIKKFLPFLGSPLLYKSFLHFKGASRHPMPTIYGRQIKVNMTFYTILYRGGVNFT